MHLSLGDQAFALLIASCQLFSAHTNSDWPAYPAISRATSAWVQSIPDLTEIHYATWAPYHMARGIEMGGPKTGTVGGQEVKTE